MHRSQKLSSEEIHFYTQFLIKSLANDNGARSGVAVNMTVREFENSSLENGLHIISVSFSGVELQIARYISIFIGLTF